MINRYIYLSIYIYTRVLNGLTDLLVLFTVLNHQKKEDHTPPNYKSGNQLIIWPVDGNIKTPIWDDQAKAFYFELNIPQSQPAYSYSSFRMCINNDWLMIEF